MGKVNRKNLIRRNLIFRALREHGELSLTDLKNKTGISIPVVTAIVSKMKEENFVVEVDDIQPTQAGRPPSVVRINGQAGYILGVDIGRINTNFVLLDLAQNIVIDDRRKSANLKNEMTFVDDLYAEIEDILKEAGIGFDQVMGLGVSIPGLVQGPLGRSHTYLNFPGKTIKTVLEERFQKPVHIEHDAKAMALGELWFGSARGLQNVLVVNIGWGLGLGIIINGKIFYGSHYYAGEFGHLQIIPNGNLCYCGKRGCLETYASGKAIAQNAREKIAQGAQTILTQKEIDLDALDARMIIEAANSGDQFCIEILEEAAGYLGYGIAQLINMFNPERVIFGGRIATVKSFILNKIISTSVKHSLTHLNENIEFKVSQLGTKVGALGVGVLAASDLFEVDHLNPSAYV